MKTTGYFSKVAGALVIVASALGVYFLSQRCDTISPDRLGAIAPATSPQDEGNGPSHALPQTHDTRTHLTTQQESASPAEEAQGNGIIELLEYLDTASGAVQDSFLDPWLTGFDVDAYADQVRRSSVTTDALQQILGELGAQDPRRPMLVLAQAWSEGWRQQDVPRLVESARTLGRDVDLDTQQRLCALAATHVLRLREEQSGLVDVVNSLSEAARTSSPHDAFLEHGLTLTLHSVDNADVIAPQLLEELVNLDTLSENVRREAWAMAVRVASDKWGPRAIVEARGSNPRTLEAIAEIKDQTLLSALEELVDGEDRQMYGTRMAQEALTGMLSIGNAESLAFFEGCVRRGRQEAQQAMANNRNPAIVGDLIVMVERTAGDATRWAAETAVNRAVQQIAGCPSESPRRAALRESLRRAIQSLPSASPGWKVAVEALTRCGTGDDLAILENALQMGGLSEAASIKIQTLRSQ